MREPVVAVDKNEEGCALAGRVALDVICEVAGNIKGMTSSYAASKWSASREELCLAIEKGNEYASRIEKITDSFYDCFAVEQKPVDLLEAIDTALLLCKTSIRNKQIRIRQNIRNLPRVLAEAGTVERAIIAMLHDAVGVLNCGDILELAARKKGVFVVLSAKQGEICGSKSAGQRSDCVSETFRGYKANPVGEPPAVAALGRFNYKIKLKIARP